MKDYPDAKAVCVSTCDTPYMAGDIPVIPLLYAIEGQKRGVVSYDEENHRGVS